MKKYIESNKLLTRAKKVTPLGAQTYSKSFRYFPEGVSPTFVKKAKGCIIHDVDGNKFIDFICALGPITVGYKDKKVNKSIIKQLNKGISFSIQSEVEVKLAEKLIQCIPGAEMVRFLKNGSDATTAAIRLARAFTKKSMVAVSGYHGMHDWYIGSTNNRLGIPKEICDLTVNFEYNNLDSIRDVFGKYKNQIAAVILEPIQGLGPNKDYLKALKEIVHDNGSVLIFDEVVSGFRYALGGAAEMYNVIPDLSAFGKGMGNGLAISVVSGRKDILSQIENGVFISTTFGGEALSIAGALEVINILSKPNTFDHFWKMGKIMKEGLIKLIEKYDLKGIVVFSGLEPHCGVLFNGYNNLNYLEINTIYSQTMIENGILTVGINNISLAHKEVHIRKFLKAADKAFSKIRLAINIGTTEGIIYGKNVNPVFKRNIN
jgi:glutamate-1-semialdehyde 2,1-aminomutase